MLTSDVRTSQENTTIARNVDASSVGRKVLDRHRSAVSAVLVQTLAAGCHHADVLSGVSIPVEVLSVGDNQASRFRFIGNAPTGWNADIAKAT